MIKKFWEKFLHGWYGCPAYNRKWPTWTKTTPDPDESETETRFTGPYASCGICCGRAYWSWGYHRQAPDVNALRVQGAKPAENDAHYSIKDGWVDSLPRDLADLVFNEYERYHNVKS
jgi:hypothetical protein